MDSGLTIREFQPGDEGAFRDLNVEWIERYFTLEPKDREMLEHPREKILDRGGRIFFAVRDGASIGCCALIAMGPGEFEVAKMAVAPSHRGGGIGRVLLEQVIAEARASGVTRLFLETNRKLAPAIRLYESVGFRHIPADQVAPSPYARCDISMELYLGESEAQHA
jgi:putative acetyltransferase